MSAAGRVRGRADPTRRVLAFLACWVVALTTVCATGRWTAHATAVPAPGSMSDTTIELVSLPPWVGPTGTVTATVRVSGAPRGATLTPVLHAAVATRSAFALTTAGENLGAVVTRSEPQTLTGTTSTLTVRIRVTDGAAPEDSDGTDEPTALLTRPGVYPLVFTVENPDGTALRTLVTHVVRLPAATVEGTPSQHPLGVATQLRLQPRPMMDDSGRLVATDPSRLAARGLIDGLGNASSATRRSFGFAISPAFVETMSTGSDTDAGDRSGEVRDNQIVADLAMLVDGLPLQSQPWAPVDPAAWLATPDLVDPLDRSVESGDATLTAELHEPDHGITDVAAWNDRASDPLLRWFVAHDSGAVLVPEAMLDDLDTAAFPRTLAAPFLLDTGDDRSIPAVQLDTAMSDHFTESDPVLGANRLIADLSVVALDLPSIPRAMVVAPPVGSTPSEPFLTAYVDALENSHPRGADPLVVPRSIMDVVDDTPVARSAGDTASDGATLERSLRDKAAPPAATALGRQMSTTGALVDSLAGMVPGGAATAADTISGMRREMQIAAMPGTPTGRRQQRFASIRDTATVTAAAIRLPSRQTITLTSDTATLPVTFRRSTDGPTVAVVHIDAPDRLHFPDGRTQTVHLDDVTTRFDLRVHSDSPGDTIVRLTITSPDSRLVAGTTELVVRSTAASGVGLVISFGSLGFLVLWWGRDIVRARRRRRARHVPPAELIDIDG